MAGSMFGGRSAQTLANLLGPLRQAGQPLQQSTKIESGTHGKNRQLSPRTQIGKHGERSLAVAARRGRFCGIENGEKMMWNLLAVGQRGLRCSDIKAAIELGGIANNNFAREFLREKNAERRFARSSRPDDCDKRRMRRHRNRVCQACNKDNQGDRRATLRLSKASSIDCGSRIASAAPR